MRLYKKGQEQSFLKGLIIFLILLIIFSLFFIKIKDVFNRSPIKKMCKADVYAKAAMGIKPLKFVQRAAQLLENKGEIISDVNCPTQNVTIKENLDTSQGQENAKKEIAIAMYDCWDQFGEGQYELFDITTGIEMYCVMCHYITFEDKDKRIDDFIDYLQENTIPKDNEVTYYDYLTGFQTSEVIKGFEQDVKGYIESHNVPEIYTRYDYAVTYFYYKKSYFDKLRASTVGTVVGSFVSVIVAIFVPGGQVLAPVIMFAGGLGGFVLGSDTAADWKSGVMLLPMDADKLFELGCTYLPGKQSDKE